ncbi:MAG: peptide ligase PGM1-related protein [Xanthomonadaceae bacterium]|nr:peptide ligase PGM1-related protein [Xanthomonadaceae bacterium]
MARHQRRYTNLEADVRESYLALQQQLPSLFQEIFTDPAASRTVVVVPGLSLDADVLAKVSGARHYEERMLSMLMLLRLPNTRVVFVTSEPIAQVVVDYYLSFLSGVPAAHARRRLVLLSAYDASPVSLTRKILERPRLMARIRAEIDNPEASHLSVFNACDDEVRLAVSLGISLYACDPALAYWGSKSGSRRAFAEAGIDHPDGFEDLNDFDEAADAIAQLIARSPPCRRLVVKINEGFSGDGNAVLDVSDLGAQPSPQAVRARLASSLKYEADGMTPESFEALFERHGGIVESWLEGRDKRSPSVQLRINPLGEVELISSHDQIMSGPSGQVFQGSTFPADARYARALHVPAMRVGEVLRDRGVMGRLSVDFVSVLEDDGWRHYAIEINLRKGGTTMPYQMLQFLTNGRYDSESAHFLTPMQQVRHYYATDNLVNPLFRRLVPDDLIDILVSRRLHFEETRQQGVVFNLIGALSEFGKLGLVCIGDSPATARRLFDDTVSVLDEEAAADADSLPRY